MIAPQPEKTLKGTARNGLLSLSNIACTKYETWSCEVTGPIGGLSCMECRAHSQGSTGVLSPVAASAEAES